MLAYKVLFLVTVHTVVTLENDCVSPGYVSGKCVDVQQCSFLQLIQEKYKIPIEKLKFLYRAECDFLNVCCPNNGFKKISKRFVREKARKNQYNECGIQYSMNRIFDGTITDLHEFPWMALLIYQTEQGPGLACGGVLINRRFVLTAAHCATGPSVRKVGNLIAVRLGEYNIETQEDCEIDDIEEECQLPHVDIYVESAIPHPNYTGETSGRYHDIALIKLKESVTYTKDVQPICLPKNSHTSHWSKTGSNLFICGWGQTETREAGSLIKLKAKVPVVNEDICKSAYAKNSIVISNTQVCAGGGTKDSCKGDSGGPLMFEDKSDPTEPRWNAVGVISFGAQPCATVGIPAVYTKITPYLDWIQSIISV